MLGPLAITTLRENAVAGAIRNLSDIIEPSQFFITFGSQIEHLDALVEAKTVTIAKLMEIAPAGTIDPTPSLYNETMYLMAFLLFVALIANAFMKPVDPKHHMQN